MPHSPWPWALRKDDIPAALGGYRVVGADNITPAIVLGGLGDEGEANARVIVAAPKMLALLKDVHEYLHGTLSPCEPGCECLLHPVEALIAEAEGRS